MAFAVQVVRLLAQQTAVAPMPTLAVSVVVGVAVYTLGLYLVERDTARDALALVLAR
jgi:fluoride ion exporter CrcB/FEX